MAENERSPNYPSLDLATATALTKRLFETEGKTVAPYEAIAQALGSASEGVSGPFRSKIAALRQYGLIDKAGSGKAKLSPRGIVIGLREPEDAGYKEALRDAALTPTLFKDLWSRYSEGGTVANMRHYLVEERGFQVVGANRAIEAYRKTVAFANLGSTSYNVQEEPVTEEATATTLSDPALIWRAQPQPGLERAGTTQVSYGWLADGIDVQMVFSQRPTAKAIERITSYLKTMGEDLQDSEARSESARKAEAAAPED